MEAARSMFDRYVAILSDCRSDLDGGTISKLVEDARNYLKDLENPNDQGNSRSQLLQQRPIVREAALTLLNRKQQLQASTRAELLSFISTLPEYLPRKYKFTIDLFSGHSERWTEHLAI